MKETELIYYRRAHGERTRYREKEMTPDEIVTRREELRYLLRDSRYRSLTDMQLDDFRMVVIQQRYMVFEDQDGYERYISREKKKPPPSEGIYSQPRRAGFWKGTVK